VRRGCFESKRPSSRFSHGALGADGFMATIEPAARARRKPDYAGVPVFALNPFPCVKVIDAINAGGLPGFWPGLC